MKLDETFIKDMKKIANGDGSREAKFNFLRQAKAAAKELSTLSIKENFYKVLCEYGRVAVGICLAATILEKQDRLSTFFVQWGYAVINLWTNRASDLSCVRIDDGLHPTRIEEYAYDFLRLTLEE